VGSTQPRTSVVDKDRGMAKILLEIAKFKTSAVAVGVFEGERREDGQMEAMIAAVHEYGSPKRRIPQRSFLRSWATGHAEEIQMALATEYKQVGIGNFTADKALKRLGEFGQAGVRGRIREMKTPALKDETVRRKKSSALLIDTGQLINTIRYRVLSGLALIRAMRNRV
jgi:hypothetical protein